MVRLIGNMSDGAMVLHNHCSVSKPKPQCIFRAQGQALGGGSLLVGTKLLQIIGCHISLVTLAWDHTFHRSVENVQSMGAIFQ